MTSNSTKLESKFQAELKKDLKKRLPGCIVMKTDPTQIQGIPDLIVFFRAEDGIRDA